MGGIGLSSAELAGAFLETFLLGLSTVSVVHAIYVLVYKRAKSRYNRSLCVVTVVIFLLGVVVRLKTPSFYFSF